MVNRRSNTSGFTLLEVLTVLAVISVLMGLMIPVLGGVAAGSRCIKGQANLRTMGQAARSWCIEHNGRFPPGMLIGTDDDSTTGDVRCWDWWTRSDDGDFARPGLLWQYTDDPDTVLQCPAYEGDDQWNGPVLPTGYNYNVAFVAAMSRSQGVDGVGSWEVLQEKPGLTGPDASHGTGATDLRLAQCRRSGTTALFGEGGTRTSTNKFMRSPTQEMELCYGGAQAFRHRGRSNVCWIDGHVSAEETPRRGQHFDALPSHLTDLLQFPANGFLSENDDAYDPR